MTEGNLDLPLPPPSPAWGDRAEPWVPDTIGRRAKAAEAAWKLDPDPDYPDTILDRGRVGHISALACAVRGSKHRFEGTERQDSAIAAAAGNWALAAVADGVGSVPESQRASEAAVRLFVTEMSRRLEPPDTDPQSVGRAVFKEVNRELTKLGGPKTTLTAAAIATRPDAEGNYRFWVAGVGDSPAFAIADGAVFDLFKLEREDEFGTFTAALPMQDLGDSDYHPFSRRLVPGAAIALVSDGIGDLLGAESEEPRRYFGSAWSEVPDPAEFMRQVQVRSRGFDDDRSAAVLWVDPEGAHTEARSLRTAPSAAEAPDRSGPATPASRRAQSEFARDVELSAARLRGLEIRAVSRRGDTGPEHRPRRARALLIEHGDRLVALAAAPGKPDQADHVGPWMGALRRAVEGFPPDQPSLDWTKHVWNNAARSLAEDPDFDLGGLATAIVCAEPAPDGAVEYELAVTGPISVSIAGAGLREELSGRRRPDDVFGLWPGEVPFAVYADRLTADQALHLAVGVGPDALAELPGRPGPLEACGILHREPSAGDRLAVALWGER